MTKGHIYYLEDTMGWAVEFAHLDPRQPRRKHELWATWRQAMSDYRYDFQQQVATIMNRKPKAQPRAILATDGTWIKGDSDHRPGDPIIGPGKRVYYVESVHISAPRTPDTEDCAACVQDELPVFFD